VIVNTFAQAMPSLPDTTPLRFRRDADLAAWLVKLWHTGFSDGNELADLLCKPLGNAGLTFPNDVDELLRSLRTGPCNLLKEPASDARSGAGWLIQEKWTAHLSDFGQSREAFLGSFGSASIRDLTGDYARFHASCYGFTPNRECQAYREFVIDWEAQTTALRPAAPLTPKASGFNVSDEARLTHKFLTNTGQRGSDEAKRTWKIQPCQCTGGKTVAVNQERRPAPDGRLWFTAAELAEQPCLKWRHIAVANLNKVS
jgi:hypothetical protein